MNTNKLIKQLTSAHPGKNIVLNKSNDSDEVIEILCEVEPTEDHPKWSRAIAVIDKSVPHYHLKLTETYKVLKGSLELYLDDKKVALKEGEEVTIDPSIVHWAKGDETWVECVSRPGWSIDDHVIIQK